MKLNYDDTMLSHQLKRFPVKIAEVADALEAQAATIRRELSRLPEEATLVDMLELVQTVVQTTDQGHADLHIYHNVLGTLVDVIESHEAIGSIREKDAAERERLATPPVDHADYLRRLANDNKVSIECRLYLGTRIHRGYLHRAHHPETELAKVRDSSRASKSQYQSVREEDLLNDRLEVKVGNRYISFEDAFPLDGWTAPE